MRISTLGYVGKQGVKNIGRNKMFSIAAIATMSACIFLFGLFASILLNFQYIIKTAEEGVAITVFFNEDATEDQISNIGKQLESRDDVLEVKYVSADDAWDKFKDEYFADNKESGAGEEIATAVIGILGKNPSPYVLTFVVFMLCCVLTNFMSNTATTALLVPICVSIATEIGADPSAVLMACVIGGSCAYATPIGMPANTMVITAGGYTFKDYAKAGIPLIVVATIVSMVLLPIFYPFFP